MIRSVTAVTLALGVMLVLPSAASAGAPDRTYVRYAKVRDQLIACSLDRSYRHLAAEKRRRCPRLRRRYTLYSFYGAPSTTFIICKTRRCPAGPSGVPDPSGSAPRRAVRVYG